MSFNSNNSNLLCLLYEISLFIKLLKLNIFFGEQTKITFNTYTNSGATSISVNGEPITNGDILGVFYMNNQGGLSLGGSAVWTGEVTSIAAWGSESGQANGFANNEEFVWYVYDCWMMTNVCSL